MGAAIIQLHLLVIVVAADRVVHQLIDHVTGPHTAVRDAEEMAHGLHEGVHERREHRAATEHDERRENQQHHHQRQ